MANGDEGNPLRAGVVFLPWFLPFWIFLSVVVNSKRKNRINFSFFSGNNDSVTFDMHVWVSVSFNFHFSLQTCQKDFHFTPSHHSLDGKVWIEKDTVGRIGLLMNTLHSILPTKRLKKLKATTGELENIFQYTYTIFQLRLNKVTLWKIQKFIGKLDRLLLPVLCTWFCSLRSIKLRAALVFWILML